MIQPDGQPPTDSGPSFVVVDDAGVPVKRRDFGLKHLRTVAMLSYVIAGVAGLGMPSLRGFKIPNFHNATPKASGGNWNQPKLRLDARRRNQHPAHHRKPSMSLRYARNHSG